MTKAGKKAKLANRLLSTYQQAISNAVRIAGRPLREQERETMAVLVKLVAAAADFLRAYEREVLGAGGAAGLAKSGGWFSAKPPGSQGSSSAISAMTYSITAGSWSISQKNSESH